MGVERQGPQGYTEAHLAKPVVAEAGSEETMQQKQM